MEELIRGIENESAGKLAKAPWTSNKMITYTIEKQDIVDLVTLMKKYDARFITLVGTDERKRHLGFGLYYVFAFDAAQIFVMIHTTISEKNPTFPSIVEVFPNCNWYEREIHDLLGLKAEGHPNLIPLILHRDWPEHRYPLRKDYPLTEKQKPESSQEWFQTVFEGEGITHIPVGPIHAGIIEPGHFSFGVAGDVILHLDAQLFFKHRGVEKRSEGMTLEEGLRLAERICGMCAVSHAVSYCLAVEKLSRTKIPRRAQLLRMIFLELERLYNHIGDIGDICSGAGFHIGTSHGARLKESLHQLNEQLTGHRFLRGAISLGGVREDLVPHAIDYLETQLTKIRRDFREIINIILDHEITVERMTSTGILTARIANELEVVGPAGRASGRKIDVRKTHPYLLYDEFSFSIPTYETGDVLARVQVRIDEVLTSISLILQIINQLEDGPIAGQIKEENIDPFRAEVGLTESALGENAHWLMINDEGRIERYRVRSAAYNNWQAVPSSVKGNIVPDFPIINKSFELCYSCCDR